MSALLLFQISFLPSFARSSSVLPNLVGQRELPDCHGVCHGNWGKWNQWDECDGGMCHAELGRRTRQNLCFVSHKLPPSRGDMRDEEPEVKEVWKESCRERESEACVLERTCSGIWSTWEEWTLCSMARNGCFRSRRRFCHDRDGKRLPGQNCLGGLDGDTENEVCNASCPHSRMSSMQTDAVTDKDSMKEPRESKNSVNTRKNERGHNTILISVVAIGSLVFGVVFVLLILNLVRKYRRRDDNASSDGDRWKRVGSTNTNSTVYSAGYTAASDMMSPRSEIIAATSPTSITESSENGPQVFGRNDSRYLLAAELPGQSMAFPKNDRPRRSRLLQENVYWEITDTTSLSIDEGVGESSMEQGLNDKPGEEVENVLYESRV